MFKQKRLSEVEKALLDSFAQVVTEKKDLSRGRIDIKKTDQPYFQHATHGNVEPPDIVFLFV